MAVRLPMHGVTGATWIPPSAAGCPAWMPRLAFAPSSRGRRGDTLVVVFLRGAADALNIVVPHGEPAYYRNRPSLAIPRPDDSRAGSSRRTLDVDGFFGLHPALGPLLPAWQANHLGVVHACGSPDDSRSHFQAMELMERGLSDLHGPTSGWIGRHLASLDTGNYSPLRAVGIGEQVPRSLRGVIPVSALKSITDYHIGEDPAEAEPIQAALAQLYVGEDLLGRLGRETLAVLDALRRLDLRADGSGDSRYPSSEFGIGMRQVAALVKAEVGLEAAAIDVGGWDTHFAQGAGEGQMAGLLSDLAHGLAAFHEELAGQLEDLTVVVMTEFGRRVRENASLGTDHGHGAVMLILGGGVVGGKVHGEWPGLEDDLLFGPGDLAVTVDYRDVLAEICQLRLNNPSIEAVFPDYRAVFRGVVRGRG
ncbi:MAG TPA: DUF1501 domain-containing protein [Anaerolineales bacterium]|nr:DUF1501 domain-containing protein [Anaerolineales bacterium]